jgi:hypothetical protein
MKTKICIKCKLRKVITEFTFHSATRDKLRPKCKLCRRIEGKEYNLKNKEKRHKYYNKYYQKNRKQINKKHRTHYLKNKKRILLKQKEKYKNNHWLLTFSEIKRRCNNPKTKGYYRYGGRGIKCLITEEELKFLWFRDKAYLMKKPSIDRIDNDGNYCLNNCRYIERVINAKRGIQEYWKRIKGGINDRYI